MIDPPPAEDRRPPLTPQLALRVAIVGSLALALFAVIFFRLWFLQVLTGSQYVKAAAVNRVRDIAIAPPRGDILDRNGTVLVDSTKELAVTITPTDLPVAITAANSLSPPRADRVVYNRLAHVLGIPTKQTHCTVPMPPPSCVVTATHPCPHSASAPLSPIACKVAYQVALLPYADATIKEPVSDDVQYYLAERQTSFTGVQVAQTYVTGYPYRTLAAQVLGTVGPIDAQEIKDHAYKGANPNSIVGQTGLESEYDDFLRGTPGEQKVQIDASGLPTGVSSESKPVAGHNLQLSLDANLQRVGQQSLAESISQNVGSDGGAFVALDPDSGSVYAMGSAPSFDPSIFTHAVSQSTLNRLESAAAGEPLFNRAIAGLGPVGSTFKPITATAALQSGTWGLNQTYDDTGEFCVGTGVSQQCRHNAGKAVYGTLNLVNAIRVSSDDFFYNLGAKLNSIAPNGGALQQWARAYGIGRNPDIDLPGALNGTLPDAKWRAGRNQAEAECDSATGPFRYTNGKLTSAHDHPGWRRSATHPPGGCGIADGTDRPWSEGDNESLGIGQGDVQVSPLQLAVVYSALANGGTIVRPHIGESVQDADGTVLQRIDPPASRHIAINPIYLQTILTGLRDAASQPGGTSDDVMGNFPQQVYGKTGTAQYNGQPDYAWYACFVPRTATTKPIVIIVTVERGGYGDVAAAPVARQMLSQWFYGKPGPYKSGTSDTL